jgi:hypothetical protein
LVVDVYKKEEFYNEFKCNLKQIDDKKFKQKNIYFLVKIPSNFSVSK